MTTFGTTSFARLSNGDVNPDVAPLVREALEHPAAQHPFLTRFASGGFRDQDAALTRYAVEYAGFAAWSHHHVDVVACRLESTPHRALLQRCLNREQGQLSDDYRQELQRVGIRARIVEGIPAAALFHNFCRAIGISDNELAEPSPAARQWRMRLMQYLGNATPTQAVGALVFGSALINRPTHRLLMKGLLALGHLRRDDLAFFELQCLADDTHRRDLLAMAQDMASEHGGIDALREGMNAALRLRCDFFDRLYLPLIGSQLANPA